MKAQILFVLASILVSGLCDEKENITSFLYTDDEGNTWLEDLTLKPNLTYSPANVMLYFFSKRNPNAAFAFKSNDVSAIQNSAFVASKPTVFVIHGWQANHNSEISAKIKDAILSTADVNVFLVDWSFYARQLYITAQAAVQPVGRYVAAFVQLLQGKGLNVGNVKMVGHSLGAHVAGNAGTALGGKVNTITGLDPAGPLFTAFNKKKRLSTSDAQFVEIIHSSAGKLGIKFSAGHADFWPNGGFTQPGCKNDIAGACAHKRSYQYYIESVRSNKFVAKKCANYQTYTGGKCNSSPAASMGMYQVDRRASGDYFLYTKASAPFAEG